MNSRSARLRRFPPVVRVHVFPSHACPAKSLWRGSEKQQLFATAEELNVSQPYISGQIAGLEARLGLALFNRVGRRAYLNEAGKLLAPYAAKILDTLKEAHQSSGPSGTS
jgi:hypothetical protein